MPETFQTGAWEVKAIPDDGGRICSISYEGNDILCPAIQDFHAPTKDYGVYETRPVYGYDDCFPSVDKCRFPGKPGFDIPDHGELCWLNWDMDSDGNALTFSVKSRILPIKFTRRLVFMGNTLSWDFEISNTGIVRIPFLHVMHPLMPLGSLRGFEMPSFSSAFDEIRNQELELNDGCSLEKYLFSLNSGDFAMLLLRKIGAGKMTVYFEFPFMLDIVFPEDLFPSIGIWWNKSGYPDEPGLRRCECAFEPIPGNCSSLERCFNDGSGLVVPGMGSFSWNVKWTMNKFQRTD